MIFRRGWVADRVYDRTVRPTEYKNTKNVFGLMNLSADGDAPCGDCGLMEPIGRVFMQAIGEVEYHLICRISSNSGTEATFT